MISVKQKSKLILKPFENYLICILNTTLKFNEQQINLDLRKKIILCHFTFCIKSKGYLFIEELNLLNVFVIN